MANELSTYPSGFAGAIDVVKTKPVSIVTAAKQMFNKGMTPRANRYMANQEVCDIWMDLISGTPEYKTFEFKERILKCALSSFGTDKLMDWIHTQAQSPYVSDTHSRWIDETLRYVFDNKTRELSGNNWCAILTASSGDNAAAKISDTVKHCLLGERMKGASYTQPYQGDITIKEFIRAWVTRTGGIDDLVNSMNVLFGNR